MKPILITSERANAVLVSEEDSRAIEETILLSISGMRELVVKGLETPIENCFDKVEWRLGILPLPQARKDAKKLSASNLRPMAEELLNILREDPFQKPPPYEKSVGDLNGAYSRRINILHRPVRQMLEREHTVKVIRM